MTNTVQLRVTNHADLVRVLDLVKQFHEAESIAFSEPQTRACVAALLGQSSFGRLWLITLNAQVIGYIAVCFGYSIEFGGRDAMIDEFFILPEFRHRGYGRLVLGLVTGELEQLGIRALHAEVESNNKRLTEFYRSAGIHARERYQLMSMKL